MFTVPRRCLRLTNEELIHTHTSCGGLVLLYRPQAQGASPHQESVEVAAPCNTRPESEQWFCSLRLGVLEGDVKSRSLKKAFGWDRPVPGVVLAMQLVSLSKKFEVGKVVVAVGGGGGDAIVRCCCFWWW